MENEILADETRLVNQRTCLMERCLIAKDLLVGTRLVLSDSHLSRIGISSPQRFRVTLGRFRPMKRLLGFAVTDLTFTGTIMNQATDNCMHTTRNPTFRPPFS